jgi:hypothetical protein
VIKTVQRGFRLVVVSLLTLIPLTACNKEAPEEYTRPTAANPQPYAGMEQARGQATLRLPRDRGDNREGGK